MLGNIFTEISRDAWVTVPGRAVQMTYNENNKPTRIDFIENTIVVFSQVLTYDTYGNCTKIECVTN